MVPYNTLQCCNVEDNHQQYIVYIGWQTVWKWLISWTQYFFQILCANYSIDGYYNRALRLNCIEYEIGNMMKYLFLMDQSRQSECSFLNIWRFYFKRGNDLKWIDPFLTLTCLFKRLSNMRFSNSNTSFEGLN